MLSECLKIKLSKFKENGAIVQIFVTTFSSHDELLHKYRQHFLVNVQDDISFTSISKLCSSLKIEKSASLQTLKSVVSTLSQKYSDRVTILLCDEIETWRSVEADWSSMKTSKNVVWLLAFNPRSTVGIGEINMKIVPPMSDDVISQQLLIKYRNCSQIR